MNAINIPSGFSGTKWLVLGGAGGWGPNNNCPNKDPGYWCAATIKKLTGVGFKSIKNAGYDGVCYDFEVGDISNPNILAIHLD